MPLQKPPPQGTQTPEEQPTKRQLQERRRTLQTISELSVTDEQNGRVSFANVPTVKRNTPNLSKRRSLPQYCSSAECLQAQASTGSQPTHASASRRSQPSHDSRGADARRYEKAWNARRERARAQHEHEHIVVRTRDHRRASGHQLRVGSQTLLPSTTPRLSSTSSQDYLKSYSSHHQLLRNSRSISGFPPTIARRPSLGGSTGQSSHRDCDTESSELASTDSSSYHSVHESAVRRSRSGSSIQSFTLQAAPPMPQTFAPPAPRYYSNPAHFHDSVPLSHFSNSMTGRPVPTTRSISLPVIRVQNASGTGRDGTQSMSRSSRASVQQQKHHVDIQTARLETLAALTASRHDSAMARHTSAPSTAHMQRHHTPSSSLPSRNSYKQCGSRTRSRSSLKVPPPAYQPGNTGNIIYLENPDKQGLLPPPDIVFEKRVIPRRESLTQWKVEREEAKVDFNGMRRADTKERVRRANELEQEKEKELLLMGKGTGMKKEKERGCLSGLFALLPRRKA